MSTIHQLYKHQRDAVEELENGNILWGGVGSGKSLTAIAYYISKEAPKDIYVITTAKKRDSLDWEKEAARFGIGKMRDASVAGVLTVDSWNNIKKYTDVENAFFIFDEQRLVGSGAWTKAFYQIAKRNNWILLSATPGDTWMDYIPVFVANGFYKNRTEFLRKHVVYSTYVKFPKVERYLNTGKLQALRRKILVHMPYKSEAESNTIYISVNHDSRKNKQILADRWNPFDDQPIMNISEMFYLLRRVSYSDPSRAEALLEVFERHPKIVIFYTFNYELEILRETLESNGIPFAEWNGHKHQEIPDTDRWGYLVQYASGSEGWNCTETNAMVFYSLTYSYKMFKQAHGRIDRLDTEWKKLYYYVLLSSSEIDRAVIRALDEKRDFTESQHYSL